MPALCHALRALGTNTLRHHQGKMSLAPKLHLASQTQPFSTFSPMNPGNVSLLPDPTTSASRLARLDVPATTKPGETRDMKIPPLLTEGSRANRLRELAMEGPAIRAFRSRLDQNGKVKAIDGNPDTQFPIAAVTVKVPATEGIIDAVQKAFAALKEDFPDANMGSVDEKVRKWIEMVKAESMDAEPSATPREKIARARQGLIPEEVVEVVQKVKTSDDVVLPMM